MVAVTQLIKITFYQHEIEAIGCMFCGVAEALKVQSILGYRLRVGKTNLVRTTQKSATLQNKY